MGVSGQILQQVMGAAEGCFGVDYPLFLAQGIQKIPGHGNAVQVFCGVEV